MSFKKSNDVLSGDLLRVKRRKGYFHYGIALDKDHVIHFSGTNDDSISNYKDVKIRKTTLSLFLRGDSLEVNTPFDSPFSREEIVSRAKLYLDQDKFNGSYYNLVTNNCEHFARYAYYGTKSSKQVNTVAGVVTVLTGSVVAASTLAVGLARSKKKKDK